MRKSISKIAISDDFMSALFDYLDYCHSRNLSPNTIGYYRDRISLFFGYCQKMKINRLADITPAVVRAYISYSLNKGYSDKTTNHGVIALKVFFHFLMDEERIATSPTDRIKPIKMERKIIQTFGKEHVEAMLARCDRRTFIGIRNYTLMIIFLDTGLRVSEVCGLRLSDVDWSNCLLMVLGKGGKQRLVPFGQSLRGILLEYVARRGEIDNEDHLFLNQYADPLSRRVVLATFHRIGKAAGVNGVRVSPHTFRHTFAKNWILSGGDSFSLQRILGHTTQQMVSQYVNLAVEDLQVQHSKFSFADHLVKPVAQKKILLK